MILLNKSQEKAIYTTEPFLFLLAGAGTGKTSVIVARIKHLISSGVKPENILAITFTNRASKEMKSRISNDEIAVHTFHQFCYQKLKEYISYDYQIASDGIPLNDEILLQITKYKNSYFKNKRPKFYDKYQQYLKQNDLKDFDDLLIDFHHYFHHIKKHVKYNYIFVDEFQDTNLLQYMIIKKLIDKDTHILCVGDPDQSIYKFRGAHAKIIQMFISDFHAKVFTLTTNYRSTNEILKLANSLIKRNNRTYRKKLIAVNHTKYIQKITAYDTQEQEAKNMIETINSHLKKGVKAQDIAVLFRNHSRCYRLREMLDETGIYYRDSTTSEHLSNTINLLSLHQSKGLEFSVVFIIGLEEGSLPSHHVYSLAELQEERRLLFVGITRAKHYLYLSFIHFNNEAEYLKNSRFIQELKS